MERLTWREKRFIRHLKQNLDERLDLYPLEALQRELDRSYNQRIRMMAQRIHHMVFTLEPRDSASTGGKRSTAQSERVLTNGKV